MVKSLALGAGIFLASMHAYASAGHESFEVCVPDGLCALRVTDTHTQLPVWLVTEESKDLSLIWDGTYWIVSDADYQSVRKLVPESLTLPAVEPTSGLTLAERRASPPPPPPPPPAGGSSPGGGLITVGNITIGGGGASCGDCHKGDMREIHKKVMDRR